jgi:hypothetical protein
MREDPGDEEVADERARPRAAAAAAGIAETGSERAMVLRCRAPHLGLDGAAQ